MPCSSIPEIDTFTPQPLPVDGPAEYVHGRMY